jgi:E3 SUMO-protein ligase PIAS1
LTSDAHLPLISHNLHINMSTPFPSSSGSSKEEDTERALKLLVNADLRDICREEGLPVSGRKADLQQRILGRLARYLNHGDFNSLTMLKFRINNPQAALKGVSPPTFQTSNSNTSPYQAPGFSPNTNARFSSPAHGRLNGSSNMPRSIFPPIKFKPSPFYDLRQCVSQCRLAYSADHKSTVTSRIELAPKDLETLRTNSSCRILLFCGELSGGQSNTPVDIAFPHTIEVRVNDQEVKSNTKGVKGKAGSTKPIDITPFIKKQSPSSSNSVSISYVTNNKV